ncbi:MAG: hypothetical protein J1E83_14285 [Lachnospiraceae bacterium]|nr:hypothetical protein [Lachnospiraceae bacterium]
MKKSVVLLIIYVFILSGCVNTTDTVSRAEYENVVSEIDDLKAQLDSMQNEKEDGVEIQQQAEVSILENEEQTSLEKVLFAESAFDWDENNTISLSIYKDQNNNYYVNGCGVYEEDNLGLLQSDYNYIFVVFYNALFAKEVEVTFTIGEEEYLFSVLNGEIVLNTIPMEEREDEPIKYINNGKLIEHGEQIMDFYNSIISNL